jgi:hypothetical protein
MGGNFGTVLERREAGGGAQGHHFKKGEGMTIWGKEQTLEIPHNANAPEQNC